MASFLKIGERRINLDHITDMEIIGGVPGGGRRKAKVYLTSLQVLQWGSNGGASEAREITLTDPAEIDLLSDCLDSLAIPGRMAEAAEPAGSV